MADTVDAATRSRIMASIRGKDTKPEMVLRKSLHARGFRYRLHGKGLPGKPDMVFRRFNAVCFVHGCFWHHHEGCRFATTPATRPDYWLSKFEGNQARDKAATRSLQESGWRVAVVWECDLKGDGATTTAERVARWLESDQTTFHSDDGFAPSEEASVVETSS
ncbi:MAG: DNA mismatch endonuclease Vsr [Gammaproteobacteria bacterium]|nr:very short patch repair endonuclease [Gammaproteobacteria bacterium]MXY54210.1 DNA mismatch endonuclease Vsr [Gammaproteobacteria bacterium]MYB38297.1 DNA mismatch endonuclease Vsr [Gammaproteobacteria bacterium]